MRALPYILKSLAFEYKLQEVVFVNYLVACRGVGR